MKKFKLEYIELTVFNYTEVAKHFENMALQGWKVIKISLNMVLYKQIQPQQIYYCIDVFTKEPMQHLNKKDYLEMCEASLWKLIGNNNQFYVFCSDIPLPPLQSDQKIMYENDLRRLNQSKVFYIFPLFFIGITYISILSNIGVNGIVTDLNLFYYITIIGGIIVAWDIFNQHRQLKKLHEQAKLGLPIKNGEIVSVFKTKLVILIILLLIALCFLSSVFRIVTLFLAAYFILPSLVHLILDLIIPFKGKTGKLFKECILTLAGIAVIFIIHMGMYYNPLFGIKVRHYMEIPNTHVTDKVSKNNVDLNISSTLVKEYNHYNLFNETKKVSIEETYYHCRTNDIADYLFDRILSEHRRHILNFMEVDASMFDVDKAYRQDNIILVKKGEHILYLYGPMEYTDEQLKEVINSYIL